ncbi:hypothetical protein FOA52_015784 [Chlamydomonas sp. UWO 241]|nr:hypothetical protein FOA52_015784 [Chlamydomonas sp. UWO 241]
MSTADVGSALAFRPPSSTLVALALGAGIGAWWLLQRQEQRPWGVWSRSPSAASLQQAVPAAPSTSVHVVPGQPEQQDSKDPACHRLSEQYARMAQQFADSGLDTAGIRAMQPLFHSVQEGTPWPKRYDDFPDGPLPPSAVRLVVLPLDGSPALAAAASALARDVRAVLPATAAVFCNARANYHVTVFHTSHPSDQRPEPMSQGGGAPAAGCAAAGPSADTLRAEEVAVAACCSRAQPPRLVLDRVVMASSGTLLLVWIDPSGSVDRLRADLRGAFPGACTKQATIIHSSLLRVLSDDQLSEEEIRKVTDVCEAWTAKLRGRVSVPLVAWWVTETEFSTVVGGRLQMPLGRSIGR